MLLDDYITHVLESKLEKEDEKVYFMRIQQMKKGNKFSPTMVLVDTSRIAWNYI